MALVDGPWPTPRRMPRASNDPVRAVERLGGANAASGALAGDERTWREREREGPTTDADPVRRRGWDFAHAPIR